MLKITANYFFLYFKIVVAREKKVDKPVKCVPWVAEEGKNMNNAEVEFL